MRSNNQPHRVPCLLLSLAITLRFSPSAAALKDIDATATIVWGPGLDASFHLPVRYIFVQLVDTRGTNLTESPRIANFLEANISGSATNDCRLWSQVLDQGDGVYVVRYRLTNTCPEVVISLALKEGDHRRPVANSPYVVKGPLYHEECNCPSDEPIENWLTRMGCNRDDSTSVWSPRSVNFSTIIDRVEQRYAAHPGAYSLCHYAIISNNIHRHCYGQHVGFRMFSDAFLLSLTRKVHLPDMHFMMNLGDWPLETGPDSIPIISWCSAENYTDFVLPTYDLTESSLEMMSRRNLDVHSVIDGQTPRWAEKIDKVFWRGRDSRQERLDLVMFSRKFPHDVDAAITNFFFFRDQIDVYGPPTRAIPFGDFFRYRYQLNVDGTVAAYRLPFLLAGDALVFKQASPYAEYFYRHLRPFEHFIPVERDLSDLGEKLGWARTHEDEVRRIIANARRFVREHLQPMGVLCEHVRVLRNYAKVLADVPRIDERFERVKQPESRFLCDCDKGVRKKGQDEL